MKRRFVHLYLAGYVVAYVLRFRDTWKAKGTYGQKHYISFSARIVEPGVIALTSWIYVAFDVRCWILVLLAERRDKRRREWKEST